LFNPRPKIAIGKEEVMSKPPTKNIKKSRKKEKLDQSEGILKLGKKNVPNEKKGLSGLKP